VLLQFALIHQDFSQFDSSFTLDASKTNVSIQFSNLDRHSNLTRSIFTLNPTKKIAPFKNMCFLNEIW